MATVVLLGVEHPRLGELSSATLGPMAGVLSRGRYPKGYPHVDPNEDALMMGMAGDLFVMAVADGHGGATASHLVINTLASAVGEIDEIPPRQAVNALLEAAVTRLAGHPPSPCATTLTVVAVRGEEAVAAGWGDSPSVLISSSARVLGNPAPVFATLGGTAPAPYMDRLHLGPNDLLALVTDGITDFLPRPWSATLAALAAYHPHPCSLAVAVAEQAGEGGGGDNLAVVICSMARKSSAAPA